MIFIGHRNLIFFVFVGNGPSKQPASHGYKTRCERIEATSIVEETLENEDMEVDDELLKNWTRKLKKTKINL